MFKSNRIDKFKRVSYPSSKIFSPSPLHNLPLAGQICHRCLTPYCENIALSFLSFTADYIADVHLFQQSDEVRVGLESVQQEHHPEFGV